MKDYRRLAMADVVIENGKVIKCRWPMDKTTIFLNVTERKMVSEDTSPQTAICVLKDIAVNEDDPFARIKAAEILLSHASGN